MLILCCSWNRAESVYGGRHSVSDPLDPVAASLHPPVTHHHRHPPLCTSKRVMCVSVHVCVFSLVECTSHLQATCEPVLADLHRFPPQYIQKDKNMMHVEVILSNHMMRIKTKTDFTPRTSPFRLIYFCSCTQTVTYES